MLVHTKMITREARVSTRKLQESGVCLSIIKKWFSFPGCVIHIPSVGTYIVRL